MPAPLVATYSVASLVAAHTAFRDLVDAGVGTSRIDILSSSDVVLASVPLTRPCGTVDPGTGRLTITPDGIDASAAATGTAAYGRFCDGAGVVHLSLPAQSGGGAVPGKLVMSSLSIELGWPVEVIFATVG